MTYYYHRLLIFVVLFESLFLLLCTSVHAADNEKVYSVSLTRKQSQLEKLIKDPTYIKNLKIGKHPPTNENVTLFKYLDNEYYAEINVGKPAQTFSVIFDTTWGDMWIPSKLCSKTLYPICKNKTRLYDSSASSTYKKIDPPRPFDVAGLVGTLGCDTVGLAHMNVTDLIFAEIREIPNIRDYATMHADGVIGMAFNTVSKTTASPFFYKLLADKKIAEPIFSFYLNRDITTHKGGTIFLGGISKKHVKSQIVYVPVIEKNYWKIEINQFSIRLNKTNSKSFCNSNCQVILDTSTNTIGVPPEYVVEINSLINAVEYDYKRYAVNCSQVQKLPTITFNIGGRDFQIHGRHYIQKMENDKNQMVCISVFSESALSGLWTLGGGFLSSVYTIFDLGRSRVGFADLTKPKSH